MISTGNWTITPPPPTYHVDSARKTTGELEGMVDSARKTTAWKNDRAVSKPEGMVDSVRKI